MHNVVLRSWILLCIHSVTQRVSISQEVNPVMLETKTSYKIYRKLKYQFMVCGSPIQKDDTKEWS